MNIRIAELDPRLQAALLTSCLAFLGWLMQSLINGPIEKSREIFMSLMSKRIEVMAHMKNFLAMIALFHDDEETCKSIKEKLQNQILSSGSTGFLDQQMYTDVLEVAVSDRTDVNQVRALIERVNEDIAKWSRRVEVETQFFMRYHSPDPIVRLGKMIVLVVRSTAVVTLLVGATYWMILQVLQMSLLAAIVVCLAWLVVFWQATRIFKLFRWILHRNRIGR